MAQLRHLPTDPEDLRYRPKVYFACHPEDYAVYFEETVKQLQEYSNCAVFYYAPEDQVELDEAFYEKLNLMNLIVMPVTTRLLDQPNRAMDVEFPYAIRMKKSVLPIMMERRLEAKYSEKFGDLQFLDKCNDDPTVLSYEEKLKRYLSDKLVSDEQVKKIQAAFDAYVFLSYRKKDRKYAQELMRLLHRDPVCRDIAIWYDEFLTPGEDFNKTILDALEKSRLFAMVVTPNVLEKPNYVLDPEYKEAMKFGKPVLPAQMLQTDGQALQDCCPHIPNAIDPVDECAMNQAILSAMKGIALRANDNDPMHNFFIGLAYLTGIDVEIDHERAVELITGAAEAGLTEAMEKLVTMYETGEGVKRDDSEANRWYEKLVEKARSAYEQGLENSAWEYFWRLDIFGIRLAPDLTASEKIHQIQHAVASEEWRKNPSAVNAWLLIKSCNRIGKIWEQRKDSDNAEKWYSEAVEFTDAIMRGDNAELYKELIDSYSRLACLCVPKGTREKYDAYRLRGDTIKDDDGVYDELTRSYKAWASGIFASEYTKYYDQMIALHDHIEHKTEEEYRRLLIYIRTALGKVCNNHLDYEEGLLWYQRAVEHAEMMTGMGTYGVRALMAEAYEECADTYLSERNYQNAAQYYTQAVDIRKLLAQSHSVQSSCDLAKSIRALGCVYDRELQDLDHRTTEVYFKLRYAEASYRAFKRKLAKDEQYQQMLARSEVCRTRAEACYLESLQLYLSFEDLGDTVIQEEIAATYHMLGFLTDNEAYMKKSLEIFQTLASHFPEVKRYTNNIEIIQQNMRLIIKEEKSWFSTLMDKIRRKKDKNG